MKPVLFFPYHDPEGRYAVKLLECLGDLKSIFCDICIGVTPPTRINQGQVLETLKSAGCNLLMYTDDSTLGQHQSTGLAFAAKSACEAPIYFGYIDRIIFCLKTSHREDFIRDVCREYESDLVVFSRSDRAWETHPIQYRLIEGAMIDLGEAYIGQRLDWVWCGALFKKEVATKIAPRAESDDFSVIAEMMLLNLRHGGTIEGVSVDWQEWEDPFWFNKTKSMSLDKKELDFRTTYTLNAAKLLLDREP